VLLAKRVAPQVPELNGKWELPGGKIEHGETPEQALVREIEEEIGFRVRPLRLLPYLHTNIWKYPDAVRHVILACYECEPTDPNLDPPLPPHVGWWQVDQIDFETTLPGTREFVSLIAAHKWFDEVFLRFECIQPAENTRKEYTMVTQPTLFSDYGLVKYWGRIGSYNRIQVLGFRSPEELDREIVESAKKRLSHGYLLAEYKGPQRPYPSLMRVIEMANKKGGQVARPH
jgi:ADP-ribose pyrophosphatase YjhB (NUDIX family)